jgi:bifunctional DNA-binding transcriptional regulator/antitoxin component of YhaV-PrlF toxin-antitoxin module
MEQVIIQDCGCIALPESVAAALDLKRGMRLDVVLNDAGDAILLTPHHHSQMLEGVSSQAVPIASCVILPPSR